MTAIPADAFRQMCRDSLGAYACAVQPVYRIPPHLDILIQTLEKVERGEIKNLMVFMPPRHGKTETATKIFPAWYLGRNPNHKIIATAYGDSLVREFADAVSTNVNSPEHKWIFPEFEIKKGAAKKTDFKTTKRGGFYASGAGGGITGRGAQLFIIDDPFKDWQDANSKVKRATIHNWYSSVALTRLEKNAAMVVIQTRWHENDLAGWLLDATIQETVDDWHILSLPAIAEEDEGWRKAGEPLWADEFPLETLMKKKQGMHQLIWAALYQQRPSCVEGLYFLRDWWQRYNWLPGVVLERKVMRSFVGADYQIYQSWDTAQEPGEDNDYSVCTTWLRTPSGHYLLDVWRRKVTVPELFKAALELALMWGPNLVIIERKASGHALIQQMKLAKPRIPLLAIEPQGNKTIRAMAASPIVEGGLVHIPLDGNVPWMKEFLDEMSAFPTATHDDIVDSVTQYLNWIQQKEDTEEKLGMNQQSIHDDNYDQGDQIDVISI